LWDETVRHLQWLLAEQSTAANEPVFCARRSLPLTRFGIYKIVRRHAASWDTSGPQPRHVTPHLFRHTAAVHLLEAGIEVNVIRGWLGHVSLDTTNRYAELTLRAKAEALRVCEVSSGISAASRARTGWKDDKALLHWLNAL
jgi:integrase/recombinase XerD